jgi:Ca-activated chloride channel family protein
LLAVRANRQAALANAAWRSAAPASGAWRRWWRRHGPAVAVLAGIAVLLVSLARPRAVLMLPSRVETVMLAIDSSGSMRASDVKPSRIELAQEAARQLVTAQPAHVKLGVVSVAGTAAVVQAPTENRDSLMRAIENLPLQRGSALGSGIVIALAALLPNAGLQVDKLINPESRAESKGNPLGGVDKSSPTPKVKLEPGSNDATAIVLMTDGQSNLGPDVLKMAQVAADLGVRVHTIGFGTPEGTVLRTQGVAVRVKLDEEPLKKIAEITRGEYFRAAAPGDMQRIYKALGMRIVMQKHQMAEVTSLLLLAGTALALAGSAWSIGRSGRVL